MTIIAQHLKCDLRKKCASCSKYLFSPKQRTRYFYCPECKYDILCDRGLIQNFTTDRNGMIKKQNLCMICRTEVEERMWPDESENIE
ncbi:MAG: hypothetical protein K9W45_00065 [Candidatus Heimdallarchaeum aukensis]|uniref:Uncharacterized protein n=1 Tax=Candidatus Heimdallarchaeum aukensis TaxID=2876573 RepID=A0A9Y1BL53_9ARCH|nr:MAG: hypothetical protein K9W45_00065 [Candidatus Heimdallarchaeum aukensis]